MQPGVDKTSPRYRPGQQECPGVGDGGDGGRACELVVFGLQE